MITLGEEGRFGLANLDVLNCAIPPEHTPQPLTVNIKAAQALTTKQIVIEIGGFEFVRVTQWTKPLPKDADIWIQIKDSVEGS